MDWSKINEQIEQVRAQAREQRKELRAAVRAGLQRVGVTCVQACYDGYGDSGNIGDVALTPEAAVLEPELMAQLEDLFWGVAYDLHPGFEINEGGDGEIEWDVDSDAMNVEHRERFIECNHYSHEGV